MVVPVGVIELDETHTALDKPAREESGYWSCVSEGRRAIDIWIGEKSDLGRGYGTQMMKLAIERSFADPTVTAVLVDPRDCNTRSHRFYERLGFEFVVQRRFGDDICFVYRLRRPETRSAN